MSGRLVAIPDTDGELVAHLGRLEEVLLHLQPHGPGDDPAPPCLGSGAVRAVQQISEAVQDAERNPGTTLFAPDSTFELVPVRFVLLAGEDLNVVAAAIAALGQALLPGGTELVGDIIAAFVVGRQTPCQLVADFARTHGLLDLAADEDTHRVAAIAERNRHHVVLDNDDMVSYTALTERALAMFHLNDPLARFLFRGGI